MARLTVRFLTTRPGAADGLPRYYWQPPSRLRGQGWAMQRIPADYAAYTDAEALRGAAIAAAEALNRKFDAARAAGQAPAVSRVPTPASGATLGDMLAAYRASPMFTRLRPSTQRGYRQCLKRIEAWGADVPLRAITPARVQALLAHMQRTPAFANACARTLQAAFKFGVLNDWCASNPATKMGLRASAPSGIVWPAAAVRAFVEAADKLGLPGVGDTVLLNEWLGQRQGDILRMPRSVYRGGNLVLRQSKTGAPVVLPIDSVPHLAARLEAALARSAGRNPLPRTIIVSDETGMPFKPDNFRHVFARVRSALAAGDEAHGIAKVAHFEVDYLPPGRDMDGPDAFRIRTTELTYMHLRHTAVVRLAEAGVDFPAIAAITGHTLASIPTILKRYMVHTAQLARLAFTQRMAAEGIKADEKKEKKG